VNHLASVVAARSSNNRNASRGNLDGNLNDAALLVIRHGYAFTRSAAGHKEVNTSCDLSLDQPAQSLSIDRLIFEKWRHQRGTASTQSFPIDHF
jgi:hypothetical protein